MPQTVAVSDFQFTPSVLQIPTGTTVTWQFTGPSPHSSTSDPTSLLSWDTGVLLPGQSFSLTFNTPGTYPYHCAVHPTLMLGTIIVGP